MQAGGGDATVDLPQQDSHSGDSSEDEIDGGKAKGKGAPPNLKSAGSHESCANEFESQSGNASASAKGKGKGKGKGSVNGDANVVDLPLSEEAVFSPTPRNNWSISPSRDPAPGSLPCATLDPQEGKGEEVDQHQEEDAPSAVSNDSSLNEEPPREPDDDDEKEFKRLKLAPGPLAVRRVYPEILPTSTVYRPRHVNFDVKKEVCESPREVCGSAKCTHALRDAEV